MSSPLVCHADWLGFRGPPAADLTVDSLPVTWSPTENLKWSADLSGTGQSSPVVWEKTVYLTSVVGPNKEQCEVIALKLATGEQLWSRSVENATPSEASPMVSKAAPTPVTGEFGVVALFEGGNLLAFQHDGTELWKRDLVAEFGEISSRHGLSSSLLQCDDRVIVWIEREEAPYILAIDPRTGKDLWKVDGLGVTSWSSPTVISVDGMQQLVFSGSGMLRGVDPQNGETLWKLEGFTGNTTPSPSAVSSSLILIGATDGRGESGGGKLKASECNGIVKVAKNESGEFVADRLWGAKRATCSFGSPVEHDGLVYMVNRTGILFCLDAETGEEIYAERTAESCWATPLALGNRIYLFGQKGTTTVVAAGREFNKLSENRLWEETKDADPMAPGSGEIQYGIAAVPGLILVRTGSKLYCVGE
ncbi:PQQ-binding-like beta-propeller repeat protein [Planctomicrobium sp. SH668]|uniref:PQQ-binding-like beta-propeller repeat protein n=1 Tax=Planctomicrobium sp. SH668 TaxID=3448126 RepID=UPI003F5C50F7